MANSMEIAGVSISVIALVISLCCLAWIIIRQFRERGHLKGVIPDDAAYNIFKGGY
jgi:hypothetical protein